MSYAPKRATVEAIKVSDALAAQASEPSWLQAQLDAGVIRLQESSIELQTPIGWLVALSDEYLILDNGTGKLSIMTASNFEKLYEAL